MLVIPTKKEYQSLVRRSIEVLFRDKPIENRRVDELKLAAGEACNIMRYVGAKAGRGRLVSITAALEGDSAIITLEDNSEVSVSRSAGKKILAGELSGEGLFSLALINKLTDGFKINTGIGGGVSIQLNKLVS